MKKGTKTIVYDSDLGLEAYYFEGIAQPFPNHFHEHYVIGLMEGGTRTLSCRNREYTIDKGCILLFNPGDNHACVQSETATTDTCPQSRDTTTDAYICGESAWDGFLYYRGLNISRETMLDLAEEITGKRMLPGFSENVIRDSEAACCLHPLHKMISPFS